MKDGLRSVTRSLTLPVVLACQTPGRGLSNARTSTAVVTSLCAAVTSPACALAPPGAERPARTKLVGNRYRIVHAVGAGATADVYKAVHLYLGKTFALKAVHPGVITSNAGTLDLMKSEVCLESTGERGENCAIRRMLPLYMGEGGQFERPFCCYGNDVDCTRCGAYGVFNAAYHHKRGEREPAPTA